MTKDTVVEFRVTAARELLAKGGITTPTLRLMRAAVAAIREAEGRGAAREREAIIRLLTEYMLACEGTAAKLADGEDEADKNMYWRADGASDAIEDLIRRLRARGVENGGQPK